MTDEEIRAAISSHGREVVNTIDWLKREGWRIVKLDLANPPNGELFWIAEEL